MTKPKPKTCGGCKHFEIADTPKNYTEKGNPRLSAFGECIWEQSAAFPMSVIRAGERGPRGKPYLASVVVFRDTNAETCKCWEGK